MVEGAWKRGPAPKDQPLGAMTTRITIALTSSWRFFWADSDIFDHFAIFSKTNSSYAEFGGVLGKREEGVSYCHISS